MTFPPSGRHSQVALNFCSFQLFQFRLRQNTLAYSARREEESWSLGHSSQRMLRTPVYSGAAERVTVVAISGCKTEQ
jgi:hypothetical protein